MTPNTRTNQIAPISIPNDWDDDALLTFEQFCTLIQTPQRTVRDWKRRKVGVDWRRLGNTGRIYTTVGEARRFVHAGQNGRKEVRADVEDR
ncbi:hypothetical protein [Nocardioides sp. NPDC006273]|uniref:hypothetical protein n=1 Tax=Nocardioides sp. NPDC006273 TaxID=3155598 RepID=UPI0033B6465B